MSTTSEGVVVVPESEISCGLGVGHCRIVPPPPANIAIPCFGNEVAHNNVRAKLSGWILLHNPVAASYMSTLAYDGELVRGPKKCEPYDKFRCIGQNLHPILLRTTLALARAVMFQRDTSALGSEKQCSTVS
jgi:hypothetical protein